jgi:hypothetical protein
VERYQKRTEYQTTRQRQAAVPGDETRPVGIPKQSNSRRSSSLLKEKETDIVKAILQYLEFHQILAWRVAGQGSAYSSKGEIKFRKSSTAGFPDIACLYRGVFVCFEVKTSTGRVSELQKEWIFKLNQNGALASVVRSVDEVAQVLAAVAKGETKWLVLA